MTSESSPPPPTLRVRINQIDYTVAPPGPLDNSSLYRVPVIRIYGDSSVGLKTCVHIHQVYPYFFVEYLEKMHPDIVNRYIAKLKHSLDHAMAISMRRNPQSPKSKFVRAVVLVKGVHFYGFHASYAPFLKVHIADPAFINRAVTILQSGTVMQTRFRVYESHISYLLQFLCDFGLYGCGWIDFGEIWQRGQDEPSEENEEDQELSATLATFKISTYFRQTRMPLEVDSVAPHILNRYKLSARNMHHKLTIPAPPLPPEPLVLSVRELWEDERQRRIAKGLTPSPDIPKDLSANSRGAGGAWVSEVRWWNDIRMRIERERGREVVPPRMSWERWVMTTFESIEALWEDRYKTWRPNDGEADGTVTHEGRKPPTGDEANPYQPSATVASTGGPGTGTGPGDDEVDVDETMLASQAMSQLMEREEVEWQKDAQDLEEQETEDHLRDEDEDAVEDGPPPDLQSSVGDQDDIANDPFGDPEEGEPPSASPSPSVSSNPFKAIWSKIAKPSSRNRSSSVVSNPKTPTKRRGLTPSWSTPTKSYVTQSPTITPKKRPHNHVVSESLSADPFHAREPQSIFRPLAPANVTREPASDARPPLCDDVSTPTIDLETRPTKRRKLSLPSTEGLQAHATISHSPETGFIGRSSFNFKVSSQPQSSTSLPSVSSLCVGRNVYVYAFPPPTPSELVESTDQVGIPRKVYRDPYYSRESDAPERPREYAGLVFHLKGGVGISTLEEWKEEDADPPGAGHLPRRLNSAGIWGWEYASSPPSIKQVRKWLEQQGSSTSPQSSRTKDSSQIMGPTQLNPYGLKGTLAPRVNKVKRERQNMTVLAMEAFAPSKGDHVPDPDLDEVVAIFYALHSSDQSDGNSPGTFACESGVIVVESEQLNSRRLGGTKAEFVDSELDLLNRVIDIVIELDPDIVSGWEVQAGSWGYLNVRGRTYGMDMGDQISRAPSRNIGGGADRWGMRTTSTFKVTGRHVLNVWRIMRSEHNFNIYTFENVVFQILRRRTPWYSPRTLTSWYHSSVPGHAGRLLRYFAQRTSMVLEILDVAEVVTKNALVSLHLPYPRRFGSHTIPFKVESFMFRIAKPENFVLLSPSKQDVGKQNAAECIPLIMEPLSAFYNSPLVVLDFQSLYPSIMIAYNYCYSTCLGRVTDFKGQYKFGVTDLRQPAGLLATVQDHINVAPNGMMYVKETVRKGLLARMLIELLDTRVMVKQAMKGAKDDKALRRILDARQLGLKFIANVTYGYTSATYSGRMPAVEIADSIVQSGRETLEKAIRVINSTTKWGARVVYGDTDSLFIYLPGKTKEQAFRIGHDMADTITSMNPAPVKLKFEKVYLPCVLMAKKRYVGFKFENPDDKEPVFDAKGIETVRRDGIPAQQKMTETCLKILFRTQDLSQVKDYCCRTWARILENKVPIRDFIFAKEVKMGTYSDKVPPPPGVTVAARRMLEDPNDEPQYGERIPYVIVRGEPGSRIVDRATAPHELFRESHKRLDAHYYISRVLIPPLERVFNLVGADVRSWFDDMPKSLRVDQPDVTLSPRKNKKSIMVANTFKIDDHFTSSHCLVCGALTTEVLCEICRSDHATTISELLSRVQRTEARLKNVHLLCASCCGTAPAEPVECESLDCPWLYERKKLESKAEALTTVHDLIDEMENEWYAERGNNDSDDSDEDTQGSEVVNIVSTVA